MGRSKFVLSPFSPRVPEGPALVLLRVIKRDPEGVRRTIG